MASEASNSNPIIVEPPTPLSLTPPSLPNSSSDPSFSPNSLGSSGSHSQNSSSTSISGRSSDVELSQLPSRPQDHSVEERTPVSRPTSSPALNSPQSPSPTPQTFRIRTTAQSSHQDDQSTEYPAFDRWFPFTSVSQKTQAIIALIGLALTIVGLWFCVRSYKMGVWTMHDDALQTCLDYVQAHEPIDHSCKERIRQGVPKPLYNLWQRGSIVSRSRFSGLLKLIRRDFSKSCSFTIHDCRPGEEKTSRLGSYPLAILFALTVILGGLVCHLAWRRSQPSEVFVSLARFEYQITRHHERGPETTRGQATRIIRHRPDEDEYPGELRRSIQLGEAGGDSADKSLWQPYNSSTDTLVNPWPGKNPSKVSITNHAEDEHHEGLIELETTGGNKTFYDQDTGEFIHITPWHAPPDDLNPVEGDKRGSVKRAIAKMFSGGTALGAGKVVGDAVKTKVDEEPKSTAIERLREEFAQHITSRDGEESKIGAIDRLREEFAQRRCYTYQAGDCVTAELTKSGPNAQPQRA